MTCVIITTDTKWTPLNSVSHWCRFTLVTSVSPDLHQPAWKRNTLWQFWTCHVLISPFLCAQKHRGFLPCYPSFRDTKGCQQATPSSSGETRVPKASPKTTADGGIKSWSPSSWPDITSPGWVIRAAAPPSVKELLTTQPASLGLLHPLPTLSYLPPPLCSMALTLAIPSPSSDGAHASKPPASTEDGLFLPLSLSPASMASIFLRLASKIPYVQLRGWHMQADIPSCRHLFDTEMPSDLDSHVNTSRSLENLGLNMLI